MKRPRQRRRAHCGPEHLSLRAAVEHAVALYLGTEQADFAALSVHLLPVERS